MQYVRCGTGFNHLAALHYQNMIADRGDDREIVADEEDAKVKFVLKIEQQVEHLCLHRNIKGGHRLVRHEKCRAGDDGAGDCDALTLAAGEFMGGVFGGVLGGVQADLFERLVHPFAVVFGGTGGAQGVLRWTSRPCGADRASRRGS